MYFILLQQLTLLSLLLTLNYSLLELLELFLTNSSVQLGLWNHSSRSALLLVLPLGGGPRDRPAAAGSDGDRVIEVFPSRGRGGRIGLLLLRLGLARHDLDVPYVDELAAVLAKRDVLNFKSWLHSLFAAIALSF